MSDYADACLTVATYNERENLPLLLQGIVENAPGLRVIVIDDGSPDGTGELADELARDRPWLTVLHRHGERGYASAHIAGLRLALAQGARRLLTMDADLSHDPAVLPALLEGLLTHDLVLGSRYVPGGGTRNWGLTRRLLSRFGSLYARSILGLRQRDCTGGFRGYRAELVQRSGMLDSATRGYGFLVEVLYRCVRAGATVQEVPIIFNDRRFGRSKLSRAIMLEAALVPWRLRFGRLSPNQPE
jgi:dolichol-phosphate mannosyltransferase